MEFKDRKFEIHKVNNTCQCRLLLFMAVQAEMQMVLLNVVIHKPQVGLFGGLQDSF